MPNIASPYNEWYTSRLFFLLFVITASMLSWVPVRKETRSYEQPIIKTTKTKGFARS